MPIMAATTDDEGRHVLIGLTYDDVQKLVKGGMLQGDFSRLTGQKGLRISLVIGESNEAIKARVGDESDLIVDLKKESTVEEVAQMFDAVDKVNGRG